MIGVLKEIKAMTRELGRTWKRGGQYCRWHPREGLDLQMVTLKWTYSSASQHMPSFHLSPAPSSTSVQVPLPKPLWAMGSWLIFTQETMEWEEGCDSVIDFAIVVFLPIVASPNYFPKVDHKN
jgi:hypothetical protein